MQEQLTDIGWCSSGFSGCAERRSTSLTRLLFLRLSSSISLWKPSVSPLCNYSTRCTLTVYKVLRGCAPSYPGPLSYVADLPSYRGLLSSCSECLVQPLVHHSTVDSRAFSVAGPQVWNCLSPEVTSAPSLTTFRTWLETSLFIRLIWHFCVYTLSIVDLAVF